MLSDPRRSPFLVQCLHASAASGSVSADVKFASSFNRKKRLSKLVEPDSLKTP